MYIAKSLTYRYYRRMIECFAKIAKNIVFWPYELIFQLFEKNKKMTPVFFLMRNPKLVLVLKLDSHSKNASVGLLCNPWPIQVYNPNLKCHFFVSTTTNHNTHPRPSSTSDRRLLWQRSVPIRTDSVDLSFRPIGEVSNAVGSWFAAPVVVR